MLWFDKKNRNNEKINVEFDSCCTAIYSRFCKDN